MRNTIRILSIILIVFGLLLAFLPNSFMCTTTLETVKGTAVPMKCHWTGICQIALGILVAVAGALSFLCKNREGWTAGGIFAVACGIVSLLIANVLIGVCQNPTMACNMAGLPSANLLAALVIATGVVITLFAARKKRGDNV